MLQVAKRGSVCLHVRRLGEDVSACVPLLCRNDDGHQGLLKGH